MTDRAAVVIGSGVSGLSCAIRLLDEGFRVRIVTRELPPQTTSAVAAAVWYPYRAYPQERVLRWAAVTLQKFEQLASVPESGVSFVELQEFFVRPVAEPWWRSAVSRFRRLSPAELPQGYIDGCAIYVPLIETPKYLPYLLSRFTSAGGEIELREISSLDEVSSPITINCSGLGARQLCNDAQVFPIRGQLVRTTKPAIAQVKVDHEGPLGVSYVVPRSDDCILGSTAEEHNWSLEVDAEATRDIVSRCVQLEPRLQTAQILGARVGLRPGRNVVRLEREVGTGGRVLIHNYGHGGAGFTLSWGCAEEVVTLATAPLD